MAEPSINIGELNELVDKLRTGYKAPTRHPALAFFSSSTGVFEAFAYSLAAIHDNVRPFIIEWMFRSAQLIAGRPSMIMRGNALLQEQNSGLSEIYNRLAFLKEWHRKNVPQVTGQSFKTIGVTAGTKSGVIPYWFAAGYLVKQPRVSEGDVPLQVKVNPDFGRPAHKYVYPVQVGVSPYVVGPPRIGRIFGLGHKSKLTPRAVVWLPRLAFWLKARGLFQDRVEQAERIAEEVMERRKKGVREVTYRDLLEARNKRLAEKMTCDQTGMGALYDKKKEKAEATALEKYTARAAILRRQKFHKERSEEEIEAERFFGDKYKRAAQYLAQDFFMRGIKAHWWFLRFWAQMGSECSDRILAEGRLLFQLFNSKDMFSWTPAEPDPTIFTSRFAYKMAKLAADKYAEHAKIQKSKEYTRETKAFFSQERLLQLNFPSIVNSQVKRLKAFDPNVLEEFKQAIGPIARDLDKETTAYFRHAAYIREQMETLPGAQNFLSRSEVKEAGLSIVAKAKDQFYTRREIYAPKLYAALTSDIPKYVEAARKFTTPMLAPRALLSRVPREILQSFQKREINEALQKKLGYSYRYLQDKLETGYEPLLAPAAVMGKFRVYRKKEIAYIAPVKGGFKGQKETRWKKVMEPTARIVSKEVVPPMFARKLDAIEISYIKRAVENIEKKARARVMREMFPLH